MLPSLYSEEREDRILQDPPENSDSLEYVDGTDKQTFYPNSVQVQLRFSHSFRAMLRFPKRSALEFYRFFDILHLF